MVFLFDKTFSKKEFHRYFGSEDQIMGIRLMEAINGVEKGVRLAHVRTGSGLDYIIVIDRGLDIAHVIYKGIPLSWISPAGLMSPHFYDARGYEWSRGFFGGMMVSCGYTYSGHPSTDEGEELGLHGRASYIPAMLTGIHQKWEDDEYIMEVQGVLREHKVPELNIVLERTIRSMGGKNKIEIHDTFRNEGHTIQPFQMLYHINVGYPLLDAETELITTTVSVAPRDAVAAEKADEFNKFSAPVPRYREKVYLHRVIADENGFAHALVINKIRELALHVRFSLGNVVDRMVEWKMMGEGTYVVGIEPSNCFVMGRKRERELGTLHFLSPGEEKSQVIELSVVEGKENIIRIAEYIKKVAGKKPKIVDIDMLVSEIKRTFPLKQT